MSLKRALPLLVGLFLLSCLKLKEVPADNENKAPKAPNEPIVEPPIIRPPPPEPPPEPEPPPPEPPPEPEPPPPEPTYKDPLTEHSWHLKNTGQRAFSLIGGSRGVDLNIMELPYTGAGVRIAVSDSGVQGTHPDLSSNLLTGEHRDYSQAPQNGKYIVNQPVVLNNSPHGTMVSGIIAAVVENNLGGRGIAPNAKMASFSFLEQAQAVNEWVDQASGEFDIFNYSFGKRGCILKSSSSDFIDQLKWGTKRYRGGKGAIYVKSAGNSFLTRKACTTRPQCPEKCAQKEITISAEELECKECYYADNSTFQAGHSYPYMIVVGAINAHGWKSSYSTPGSSLWVSAPGGEYGVSSPAIITTNFIGCGNGTGVRGDTTQKYCDYTSRMNGTSSAAPMTTGVVALMLEANPNLTWRDVKYILAKTATKNGLKPPRNGIKNSLSFYRLELDLTTVTGPSGHTYMDGWITNGAGFNFHNYFGFGRIDGEVATTMAKNYTSTRNPFQEKAPIAKENLSKAIPDFDAQGTTDTVQVSSADDLEIEAVQIRVDIAHPRISDIGIELTSPAGTKSVIMPINSRIIGRAISTNHPFSSNAFYGESSEGTWTIKILDGRSGETGNFNSWSLIIFGH